MWSLEAVGRPRTPCRWPLGWTRHPTTDKTDSVLENCPCFFWAFSRFVPHLRINWPPIKFNLSTCSLKRTNASRSSQTSFHGKGPTHFPMSDSAFLILNSIQAAGDAFHPWDSSTVWSGGHSEPHGLLSFSASPRAVSSASCSAELSCAKGELLYDLIKGILMFVASLQE